MAPLLGDLRYLLAIFVNIGLTLAGNTPYQAPGVPGVFNVPDFPPPPMSKSCMTISLSSPFWKVSSFHRSPKGDVKFKLDNTADNSSVYCEGGNVGECRGENYGSYEFDNDSRNLVVKQHWACDDLSPGIPRGFSGQGNQSMQLSCGIDGCSAATTSIRVSLLEPVEITPVIPPAPQGHNSPGCTSRSSQPISWKISNYRYITDWEGPCTINSFCWPVYNYVGFDITNPITNVTKACSLTYRVARPLTWEVTAITIECALGTYYRDGYNLYTQVNASNWVVQEKTLTLSIAEQWYCDDDVTKPVQFTHFGLRNLTGTANETTFNVTSSHIVKTPMEPHALEFPKDVQSCTVESLTPGKPIVRVQDVYQYMRWTLVTYETSTATNRTGYGEMYTSIHNSAQPNRGLYCRGQGNHLNPNLTDVAFDPELNPMFCQTIQVEDDPKNTQGDFLPTYLSYDNRTSILTLHNSSWTCYDKDPKHPIEFTTSGKKANNKAFSSCWENTPLTRWTWQCDMADKDHPTEFSVAENLNWHMQGNNTSGTDSPR